MWIGHLTGIDLWNLFLFSTCNIITTKGYASPIDVERVSCDGGHKREETFQLRA